MKCPDTDRLVELVRDELSDLEALAHVRSCPDCRREYQLLQRLSEAFRPSITISQGLVQRTMHGIRSEEQRTRPPASQLAAAAALGALTVVGALVVTGAGPGDLPRLVVFAAAAAIGSAWYETRAPAPPLRSLKL